MPLPPKLDQEIRSRFDELIKEGTELVSNMKINDQNEQHKYSSSMIVVGHEYSGHTPEYNSLVVKSCNLIGKMFGNSGKGEKYQQRIEKLNRRSSSVEIIVGILKGLKDDYENGFLDDLEKWITAEISADYMGQAEVLLGEGASGQYAHVPAAVLCGAVLEDSLRRLCQRQAPSISITKPNGQPKKLNALIDELQKADVFNKLKAGQLRSFAQIRNSAAHGQFNEFKRSDVESMLKGVGDFLADYL